MHRLLLAGSATIALAIGLASAAQAKDLCINNTLVLKGLSAPPARGKCKSVAGHSSLSASALSGTACTDSAGTHVTIALTLQFSPPGSVGSDAVFEFPLPLPTSAGTGHFAQLYPTFHDSGDASGQTLAVCSPGLTVP